MVGHSVSTSKAQKRIVYDFRKKINNTSIVSPFVRFYFGKTLTDRYVRTSER